MTISSFTGPYAALSNFSPHEAVWANVVYATAEHAFAAAKTTDPSARFAVSMAPTPGAAKAVGRRLPLRPDWDSFRLVAMRWIIASKFQPGTEPHSVLMGTGNSLLVEGNRWHDQFWGNCTCSEHPDFGRNNLGWSLMALRSYYRTGAEA